MSQINIRQLEKMEVRTFENALRLHFDAFNLFTEESFPSSYFIDVLALEEIGKVAIIDFIIYHTILGDLNKKYYDKYTKSLYRHRSKQIFFATNYYSPLSTKKFYSFFKKMENNKQNAVYVGIKKGNNHLNIPIKLINRDKAINQLRFLNNMLLKSTQGLISYDSERIEEIIKSKKISLEIKRIKNILDKYKIKKSHPKKQKQNKLKKY